MNLRKSLRTKLTLLIALSVLVGACANSGEDPGDTVPSDQSSTTTTSGASGAGLDGLTFAFAIPTSAAEVYVNQERIFTEQAEALGATVETYDNNGDATTMLSNAELMVAAEPDVIVEFPSAANATERVGEIFADAGIPCIALNVPVPGCSFFNFDQVALAEAGAEEMAALMAERGWDGTNTTVVIGQASELGESVNIAVTSFYAKMSELVPGMTALSSSDITSTTTVINGDEGLQADMGLSVDTGYNSMLTALQTIPQDRNLIVYTVSDDVTRGAIRALEEQSRSDVAMVSGYGASPEALEAIRTGDLWVTDQNGFFPWWGEFVLAMAVAMADGVEPPELTVPPQVVITKENVDDFFESGGAELILMPALPPESEYLLDTAILQEFGNVEGATD